ncbi:MAG: hypothetical protein WAV95_13810 [Azonexus sp.]
MNRLAFRCSLPVFLLALSGAAYALGLGELHGQPNLGERLRLEVDILGEGKASLDSGCFRLVQPAGGGDLPWLKKATLTIRKGSPSVLQISSEAPLREPITQIALHVGCGHEFGREYMLLASPVSGGGVEPSVMQPVERPPVVKPSPVRARPSFKPRDLPAQVDVPQRLAPLAPGKRPVSNGLPDRLMLSAGVDVGEPSLRLATELPGSATAATTDAQRDILRLEFRMLLAMNEQATTQLATAEKLRNMEGTLGELQQRATDFSQRVEKGAGAAPADPAVAKTEAVLPPAVAASSETSYAGVFYGLLLGALLGLLGWFGWRKYQEYRQDSVRDEDKESSPYLMVDPKRDDEREEPGVVDLPVEPVASGLPMAVDLELDGREVSEVKAPAVMHSESLDSVLSVSATTLDEHFEANPVMELADIMLSFGRVKGAAQALQEYIDNNPQEALQPWIRLMDVYRMAGMRAEFEAVSRNLNQNFNVEVQEWGPSDAAQSLDLVLDEDAGSAPVPVAPKPECLEDMPRLMATVCELWGSGDVVGYLYQLLRDNRGGQRVGFSLPVVEEILFLIELKETAHRMEKEAVTS